MVATDLLAAMTERIVRRFAPIAIVLFGSQARGDAGPRSDVDLLVVLPEVENQRDLTVAILRELDGLGISKDVIVTTPEEIARRGGLVGTVLRPALLEGRVLYQRPGDGHLPEVQPVTDDQVRKEVDLWLSFVDDDMAVADLVKDRPDISPRQAGFHAQQAAEKALKAVYVFLQVQYPFTHDLDKLRDGLPADWPLKAEFADLRELSLWAIEPRYPGAQTANTRDDLRRHVEQARALIAAVRRDLAAHGY